MDAEAWDVQIQEVQIWEAECDQLEKVRACVGVEKQKLVADLKCTVKIV